MSTWVIIPCVAEKATEPCFASQLYTSVNFTNTLRVATSGAFCGGEVLILSALYGLMTLDTWVEPYDVKMGDRNSVTADTLIVQAEALGISWGDDVYALLPSAYYDVLSEALGALDIYPQNVYEAAPGIGFQREVVGCIRRSV